MTTDRTLVHKPSEPEATGIMSVLTRRLSRSGLLVRGGFHFNVDDGQIGKRLADRTGYRSGTLVLIGNAGPAMWQHFVATHGIGKDPMNDWTTAIIDPIAEDIGAVSLFAFDQPHWPFQQWAQRAEDVHPSPLGLLIHPEYGLWHAYRAALIFEEELHLPQQLNRPSPCASCSGKPCLSACPVGAFSGEHYDFKRCAGHIGSDPEKTCLICGCLARGACPVGKDYSYDPDQLAFHMMAYSRAVGAQT